MSTRVRLTRREMETYEWTVRTLGKEISLRNDTLKEAQCALNEVISTQRYFIEKD